jgi:heme exporter protein C
MTGPVSASGRRSVSGRPSGSGRRWPLRVLGGTALVGMACTVWLGLWVTPPDKVQGNLVRLVYVHPPIAWVALYLAFGTAAIGSVLWLWPRTRSRFWDNLAAAAMEVGTVFTALTLVTGAIWGRPTWGVWWAWDARLTSTALLLVLQLGYLALRRVPGDTDARARRCAVGAVIAAVDVPIVHFSVDWWKTLHQGATVLNPDLSPTIHGIMAWTLLLAFVAMTLVFFWMLIVRYRIQVLSERLEGAELEVALHERWAEGTPSPGPLGSAPGPGGEADDEAGDRAAASRRGEQPAELVP